MVRKSLHETTFPRVKKYMSEADRAVTADDIAQSLEMSLGGTSSVLKLMEVFKMVQKVKRGGTYYFLKDVYDDEQIEAMLPPKKVAPVPRRRRYSSRQSPAPFDDSFMEEYLSAVRVEPSSDEGLTALSMIGFPQDERAPDPLSITDLHDIEEMGFRGPMRVEAFATVEYLPKTVRLLNSGEARYLKDQLRTLRGFELIEDLGTVFAKFSALEHGRFGNIIYFSLGTNQWDYVSKVTIDRNISDFMVLPSVDRRRWKSWNRFLKCFNRRRRGRPRKARARELVIVNN